MRDCEFFSHQTAALIWGAPLPETTDRFPHVSVFTGAAAPRTTGVHGHRVGPGMARIVTRDGLRVTSPASTWAMLGQLGRYDLVAGGDYFARVWRAEGYYRVNAGMAPLASVPQLVAAVGAGRRVGIDALRRALPLIRTDAWSRPETWTRLVIVDAGLPEPVLNSDQYDAYGAHLACIDLAYPEHKVAIEYQGQHHGARYVRDIERIERLRSEGWIVVQVTAQLLFENPAELVRRVRNALVRRGWHS